MRALYSLLRNGISEVSFYGELIATDGDKILYSSEPGLGCYPARSLLKPFQFLATELPTQLRYAASNGSISANETQVKQLEAWYADAPAQARISKLKYTPSYPMDEQLRAAMKRNQLPPNPMHHTCFSKHVAILEACEINGWSQDDYNQKNHPYHTQLLKTLALLLDEDLSQLITVVDGCTLPSPVLRLEQMARLYQSLAAGQPHKNLKAIRDLMVANPNWIGGPGRTDTKLMETNPGQVIAKEGADGLLGLAVLPSARFPQGLGIVVKSAAGFLQAPTGNALGALLQSLGLKPVIEVPKGQTIHFHYQPSKMHREWLDISPLIDEELAVWPGDVKFSRRVTHHTGAGDNYTLSSIETTLHLGAHADAPVHFVSGAAGIDGVSLDKYVGRCQVIEILKTNGQITPSDFAHKTILAPRVLIKTNSFPDPKKFNRDFAALSKELVVWLSGRGVCLVGIDTPSVDSFDSKSLEAHHACVQFGLVHLEGIVLKEISEGFYTLSALPLNLKGADASPVRAALRPE